MLLDLVSKTPMADELQALWRPVEDYSFVIIAVFAWAEVCTSICATFSKRMVPLRRLAMINNVLGVTFGAVSGSVPTAMKHFISLPLNAARMREMNRLVANVRRASETDLNYEWLKPFMHPRVFKARRKLFSKGDAANEAFFLTDGTIEIPELAIMLTPGALFGEMGFFTMERTRTASAVCLTDVHLLAITYEQLEQLYFQNPEFALYISRLMVRRFMINQTRADAVKSLSPKRPFENTSSNQRNTAWRQGAKPGQPRPKANRPRKSSASREIRSKSRLGRLGRFSLLPMRKRSARLIFKLIRPSKSGRV
jgi:CRP/FNR family transcriptional regulator, cyclic AMP receptor protein